MLKKVTIIGLGMMGASISLALKKRDPKIQTTAVVRKEKYVKPALDENIVDEIFVGPNEKAFQEADIVIVGVPVLSIIKVIEDIKPYLSSNSVVTDIGSVKGIIAKEIQQKDDSRIRFVGSHPMCGSEKAGMHHGDGDLFEGATCIITPCSKTNPEDIQKISDFWSFIGCRIIKMDPHEHDRQTAIVSHMPHLLSSVLMNHVFDKGEDKRKILDISGSGFSDMTRLSGGIPSVWMDIFESNLDFIIKATEDYKENLEEIIQVLKDNDTDKLFHYLKQGQERRANFEDLRRNKKV